MTHHDLSQGSQNPYTITERHGVLIPCFVCKEVPESITVDGAGYHSYFVRRNYIQDAFPTLSPSEREFILSGVCVGCQDELFGEDE